MIRFCKSRQILKSVCATIVLALLILVSMASAHAEAILDVDANVVQIDLSKYRSPIAAERAQISLQGPGDPKTVALLAKGPGPTYFWSLFSLRNTTDKTLDFVIEFDTQRFIGSGIFPVKQLSNSVLGATATNGQSLVTSDGTLAKTLAFHIAPKEIFNIAVESPTVELQATLWQDRIWSDRQGRITFFNGLVFGVALLVAFGLFAIYGFRPHGAFLSAALFAVASLLFISFVSGRLTMLVDYVPQFPIDENILRALVESALAASLAICVLSFTRITKGSPSIAVVVIFLGGLMLANCLYAFAEPLHSTSVARIGFAVLAFLGFMITLSRRKKTEGLVDPNLVFWICLMTWTIFAAILGNVKDSVNFLSPLLQGALAVTLVVMITAMLRFLFNQGLNAKPFITDSSRRSLALSSAGHALWEWQPSQNQLSVGDDLPRTLGINSPAWQNSTQNALLQIMHPQDVANYMSIIESADRRAGQMVIRELRLRDAEGYYRWYLLRARWLPGPNQTLDRCIGTLTDITKDKQAEERLTTDAVHDAVTGLPNRILFIDRVDRELKKTLALPFRVLLVDIDRLKTLNDALGHEFGDQLLKTAGTRISECIESDETVARVSGSQFAVLAIEAIARRSVNSLSEKINLALSKPIAIREQNISLLASIGMSEINAPEMTANTMMQQATTALLEAQQKGGGKAVEFHGELTDNRASELSLESDLRRAISNDEIEVHYQPISYLNTMEIAGFEALARWRHPTQGLLPPLQFIELAEKIGLINEIGEIVLTSAARQLGIWQRVLRRDKFFFVGVNISANHLMDANFIQQVRDVINRETLSLGSLKLEITESVIMRQPQKAAKILQSLRTLGVGIACDDFGTGFSSLSSLRDFPFDTLKIDRSFIDPDTYDERSATIISTITELAHRLGMTVVAEGIEEQNQIDNLALLNCDLGQGYLIGQPMTVTEVADLLQVLQRKISSNDQSLNTYITPQLPESIVEKTRLAKTTDESPLRKSLQVFADYQDEEEEFVPELLPSIFSVPRPGSAKPRKAKPVLAKKTAKPTLPKPKKKPRR